MGTAVYDDERENSEIGWSFLPAGCWVEFWGNMGSD